MDVAGMGVAGMGVAGCGLCGVAHVDAAVGAGALHVAAHVAVTHIAATHIAAATAARLGCIVCEVRVRRAVMGSNDKLTERSLETPESVTAMCINLSGSPLYDPLFTIAPTISSYSDLNVYS